MALSERQKGVAATALTVVSLVVILAAVGALSFLMIGIDSLVLHVELWGPKGERALRDLLVYIPTARTPEEMPPLPADFSRPLR